jgi:DNA polymerase III delta prime subunit
MNSFEEFIKNIQDYKHHALLLVCKQFENMSFPEEHFKTLVKEISGVALFQTNDVSFFDIAASHNDIFIADRTRKILRIEDLAKIKELVLYQPSEGKRRLFFIENCERMNTNSANALLKSLEEPQAKSIFILTTKNLSLVLPTISSRCQKVFIHFKEISKKSILDSISQEDFNLIKLQIDSFKNFMPNLVNSLQEKETKTVTLNEIKSVLEISEKLSKEYQANLLQDLIVLATNERLKKDPSFLIIAKSILANVTEWKNAETLNPSSQLWLNRIFLGYKLN